MDAAAAPTEPLFRSTKRRKVYRKRHENADPTTTDTRLSPHTASSVPDADTMTTGSIASAPMQTAVPLDAEKTEWLNRLATAEGAQFDRLYGQSQRAAHRETLALYRSYAANGTDPATVEFARSTVPHLQHHLADANRLPGGSTRR